MVTEVIGTIYANIRKRSTKIRKYTQQYTQQWVWWCKVLTHMSTKPPQVHEDIGLQARKTNIEVTGIKEYWVLWPPGILPYTTTILAEVAYIYYGNIYIYLQYTRYKLSKDRPVCTFTLLTGIRIVAGKYGPYMQFIVRKCISMRITRIYIYIYMYIYI